MIEVVVLGMDVDAAVRTEFGEPKTIRDQLTRGFLRDTSGNANISNQHTEINRLLLIRSEAHCGMSVTGKQDRNNPPYLPLPKTENYSHYN